MLKRVVLAGIVIALLVPVSLGAIWVWGQAVSPAVAQNAEGSSAYNVAETITVVGQGSVNVKPDVAQVSIGVESSAETVSEAVADNQGKMESILAALGAAGIEEKDIQTMHFSIQLDRYPEPVPVAESAAEVQPVYRVSNMVNVTVRDLDSVGDVLDAVVEAGANNIWGVSFSVDDPKEAQADARAEAIADARSRAGALAELTEVTLGPVMSVSEVLGAGGFSAQVVVEKAMSASGSISPGEVEVSYQVQVTYFIER
jgi:uncharacterized protein YggE